MAHCRRARFFAPFAATFLFAFSAQTDGTLTSTASVTATVLESISISSGLSAINLGTVDTLDASAETGSSTFTVKANATDTVYDVWISVPQVNLDATNDVYLTLAHGD